MDLYFVVAELSFPNQAIEAWLKTEPPQAGDYEPNGQTIAEIIRTVEGDVLACADEDRLSLRATLIDGAYFTHAPALAAALSGAAAHGASGDWFSGEWDAGVHGVLSAGKSTSREVTDRGGKKSPVVAEIRAMIDEAGAHGTRSMRGERHPDSALFGTRQAFERYRAELATPIPVVAPPSPKANKAAAPKKKPAAAPKKKPAAAPKKKPAAVPKKKPAAAPKKKKR